MVEKQTTLKYRSGHEFSKTTKNIKQNKQMRE
jgi:hypothetical protein